MTPKDKSIDLYNKFYDMATVVIDIKIKKYVTKECAIVAANEMINECNKYFEAISKDRAKYWQEVKQEIEKL
jgi:hypothetical protein